VLFRAVAELAEGLAAEGSRLKKRAAIAAAIRAAAAESVEEAGLFALYMAGMPFAESDARRLNAGGALLTKALLAVSGASEAALSAAYRRYGDLGTAGFELLRIQSSVAGLTIHAVAEVFAGMAVARTTAARLQLVEGLLRRASALEAKLLLKLMLGDMRIGVKQSLVEEAIAVAASEPTSQSRDVGQPGAVAGVTTRTGEDPTLSDETIKVGTPVSVAAVRNAVMLEADLAGAVRRAFEGTLGEARMRLFHPLGFMLASPVESPEAAVKRFMEKPEVIAGKGNGETQDKSELRGSGRVPSDELVRSIGRKRGSLHSAADDAAVHLSGQGLSGQALSSQALSGQALCCREDESLNRPVKIEAFLEDKYDGIRAQVHCGSEDGRVAIYSRSREDVTESFPELAEAFAAVAGAANGAANGEVILDGEILGWDLTKARALPFAVLGQRIGRKRVSNELRRAVPVVFMAFDVMYAGGALLLDLPLRERRNRLEAVVEGFVGRVVSPLDGVEVEKVLKGKKAKLVGQGEMFGALNVGALDFGALDIGEMEGLRATFDGKARKNRASGDLIKREAVVRLMISPSRLVESAEDIDRAYAEARARANEGVMLKAAGSVYQPGRRGLAWVKLKRELATLDVVVTGAEFGHGRRAGILSDYTFAVRAEDGELLNVGKAYSGLTDAEIGDMSAWMMAHTLEDEGHFRTVEPLRVLEVAFNNVMRSERYASGFALRFPRIVRIRTDKMAEEIDTVARVEEIYLSQVDRVVEG
jgi:DNA ligase-1